MIDVRNISFVPAALALSLLIGCNTNSPTTGDNTYTSAPTATAQAK